MNVELSEITLPSQSEVKVELTVTAPINVTAQSAQRQVSKLLLDQVGNLLYGERPNLVAGEKLWWRVPVWIALPTTGPLGQAGTLDVDAQSGEILYTQFILDDIEARAHALIERSSSSTR
ncbi:MAG: hypothetical protein HND44_22030 [Chloroflexi bacterium]|nr:hypothetical protein [Ardenticatenaceae bacterium]NOG37221.1 hypothetical protein [Chloroflexota bacterium]GIK56460.1 MAG: hypothetical protein BroJett015_21230 [Chloroflexota bacterium]